VLERMDKISPTKRKKNEVIHAVKVERNLLHTINRRKANWISQIMHRYSLLKQIIERREEKTRNKA
jgi:hypothetical protein